MTLNMFVFRPARRPLSLRGFIDTGSRLLAVVAVVAVVAVMLAPWNAWAGQVELTFGGLVHQPLGQADLTIEEGVLSLGHLGNSGADGVGIMGGGLDSLEVRLGLAGRRLEPGDELHLEAFGSINGGIQSFAELRLEGGEEGTLVEPTFMGMGSDSYRVVVLRDGRVVHFADEQRGVVDGLVADAGSDLVVEVMAAGTLGLRALNPGLAWRFPGGEVESVDRVVLLVQQPTESIAGIERLELKASGLPQVDLTEYRFQFDGWPLRALGTTSVEQLSDRLQISNLGSGSGQGLSMELRETTAWSLTIEEPQPSGLPAETILSTSTFAVPADDSSGVEDLIARVEWVTLGSQWGGRFAFFPESQQCSYVLEVLREGVIVDKDEGLTDLGVAFNLTGILTWSVEVEPPSAPPQVWATFDGPTTISIIGRDPVTGDQLRVYPICGASIEAGLEVTGLLMQAVNLPLLVIQGLKGSKVQQPTVTSPGGVVITRKACRVGGNPTRIRHFLEFDNRNQGMRLCFTATDQGAVNLVGPNTGNPFGKQFWNPCVDALGTCQVGFTGELTPLSTCTAGQSTIRPMNGLLNVNTAQMIEDLQSCPQSIQICDDDDLMFAGDFEEGDCSDWSTSVPDC